VGSLEFPSAEETVIPKFSHQNHADKIFQLSRGSAQRIRTTEKEKVTAEFYN